jgi:hypothetical protein
MLYILMKLPFLQNCCVNFEKCFSRLWDEVAGGGRNLHNEEELHNLYSSSNIIRIIKSRMDEMGGAYSAHGGDNKCIKNFVWKA